MVFLVRKGGLSALLSPLSDWKSGVKAEAEEQEDVWRVVQARRGGFQAEFPTQTREEVQLPYGANPNAPTIYQMSLEWRGFYYHMNCSNFGKNGYSAQQALVQLHQELQRKDYRVLRQQEMYVLGKEGWMWEYIYRSSGTRCVRRAVCIDNRLYRMDVTFSQRRSENAIEYYSRFFDSVALIKDCPAGGTL